MNIKDFRQDLRQFERALDRLNKTCCFVGTHISQCHAIIEIGLAQEIGGKELGTKLGLDKSTVSRLIEKLVISNMVIRKTAKNDRRSISLSLSSEGLKFYELANQTINENFQMVFNQIPEKELYIFLDVFKKVSQQL